MHLILSILATVSAVLAIAYGVVALVLYLCRGERVQTRVSQEYKSGQKIAVECFRDDVEIRKGEGGEIIIDYLEYAERKPSVCVNEAAVTYLGKRGFSPWEWVYLPGKVCVTLPANFDSAIEIETTTGKLEANLSGAKASALVLRVTTGSVTVSGATATGDVEIASTTGSVSVQNLTAGGSVSVASTTGSVSVENLTAGGKASVASTTGSVSADSVVAEKDVEVSCTTGRVKVVNVKSKTAFRSKRSTGKGEYEIDSPKVEVKSTTGGTKLYLRGADDVRVYCTTGSIVGSIEGKQSDYGSIDYSVTTGKCNLPRVSGEGRSLYFKTNTGNIFVEFTQR